MEQAILRKGNLYNPLTKRIDNRLLDSDQYDLEVTIGDKTSYYRVRYNESFFEAEEVQPEKFVVHRYNTSPVSTKEIRSFTITSFFKEEMENKKAFPRVESWEDAPYYAYLQRKKGKKNINHSSQAYSFSLPALGVREKIDVSEYDIEVELANNRYYVVFITEKVNEYGLQRRKPLYMIYEKKDFAKMKAALDEVVLDIAIQEDYPLNLLQYVYIATGEDYKLISEFFHLLDTAKDIESLLKNPLVKRIISKNEQVKEELIQYLSGEQDDINYTFQKTKKES